MHSTCTSCSCCFSAGYRPFELSSSRQAVGTTSHEQMRSLFHLDLAYLIVTLSHLDTSRSAASHPLRTRSPFARPGPQHDDAVLPLSRCCPGLMFRSAGTMPFSPREYSMRSIPTEIIYADAGELIFHGENLYLYASHRTPGDNNVDDRTLQIQSARL